MTRRRIRWLVAAAVLFASCGGDEEAGRRDPLTSSFDLPNGAELIYTSDVDGLPPSAPGESRQFGLYLGPTCLLAGLDQSFSGCMSPLPSEATTMIDGGVHDDVSLAWLVSGDTEVTTARFWLLDGTTVDRAPILADGWDDPPIVFGHAVATNEIVGIELLDAEGRVLAALSVGPSA